MAIVAFEVICDKNTFLDWMVALGTWGAAIAAVLGAGAAIYVANRDRQDRATERDYSEHREAQAQADLIIVGFPHGTPDTKDRAPILEMRIVAQNYSSFPILDVTHEVWTIPYTGQDPTRDSKLIAQVGGKAEVPLEVPVLSDEHLYARRAKWRDHYGRIWVLNKQDERPEEYIGQPPKPLRP
jgi:hypothetical protein